MRLEVGFYLSVYCCIDSLGFILNAQIRHDQNIALWYYDDMNKLTLIRYWELERLTGQKHHRQPFRSSEHLINFINCLLSQYDLCINDMVQVFGTPEIDTSSKYLSLANHYDVPLHAMGHAFSSLIDTRKCFSGKHLVLAVDGGPDNLVDGGFDMDFHYIAVLLDCGNIVSVEYISSPACIWSEASSLFCMPEGSLMALAEACTSTIEKESFFVDDFYSMWESYKVRNELERLFKVGNLYLSNFDSRFTKEENIASAVMKLVQRKSSDLILAEVDSIIRKFRLEPSNTIFSITGGFALNCPTNSEVMKVFGFKDFVSPPVVNDAGLSLGLGLLYFYSELRHEMDFKLKDAFYGGSSSLSSQEISSIYSRYIKSIKDYNPKDFLSDIENFPVCWFEGKSEIGPRALGHRSIISSATSIEMKNLLNKIKQRQWWRPVAPIVLKTEFSNWFETCKYDESPYMLKTYTVKSKKQQFVPAILHHNLSARVQTITMEHSFYHVLNDYFHLTGIPILCNTSLNDKGEPIIEGIEELFNFALRKEIPVIYIENVRYELMNFDLFHDNKPQKREAADDFNLSNLDLTKLQWLSTVEDDVIDYYVNHRNSFEFDDDSLDMNALDVIRDAYAEARRKYENISS